MGQEDGKTISKDGHPEEKQILVQILKQIRGIGLFLLRASDPRHKVRLTFLSHGLLWGLSSL